MNLFAGATIIVRSAVVGPGARVHGALHVQVPVPQLHCNPSQAASVPEFAAATKQYQVSLAPFTLLCLQCTVLHSCNSCELDDRKPGSQNHQQKDRIRKHLLPQRRSS